jgi:hypothetical protein
MLNLLSSIKLNEITQTQSIALVAVNNMAQVILMEIKVCHFQSHQQLAHQRAKLKANQAR